MVSIPSKPGRVLQDRCIWYDPERRESAVSLPSKPGRVLQGRTLRRARRQQVSIPSKPGRVLQVRLGWWNLTASGFNPVQAGKGSARTSAVPRAGSCRVSIPSKPGRVLQVQNLIWPRSTQQCFNPVQAGKGSARAYYVDSSGGAEVFQSRPSREGFCKLVLGALSKWQAVSIPSKPGRVLQGCSTSPGSRARSFNPVQAGKGSARGGEGDARQHGHVSIPSKPGRVLQATCYPARV